MTHASVEWNGYDDHYLKYQRRPTPSLDEPRYTGFHRVLATQTFDAYRSPTWPVLILRWFRFGDSTQDDVRRLLRFADGEGLLDYSIVWDGARSLGGTFGAWVLQRLQPQPFRMTFGNVRISDVTPALTQQLRATAIYRLQAAPPADQRPAGPIHEIDGGGFLLAWLDEDLSQAIAAGEEYSTSVPFKSYFLPKDADGTVHPAPVHFRGPMAILLSPHGCSHVDQFAAMFIDNGLGHSVGMPAGGCSNTWEWTEVLRFPRTGEPVMAYSWTVGQTLRPNGEVLEGNPAQVRHYLPLTRDNYLTYYDELLESALAWIKRARDGEGRR